MNGNAIMSVRMILPKTSEKVETWVIVTSQRWVRIWTKGTNRNWVEFGKNRVLLWSKQKLLHRYWRLFSDWSDNQYFGRWWCFFFLSNFFSERSNFKLMWKNVIEECELKHCVKRNRRNYGRWQFLTVVFV